MAYKDEYEVARLALDPMARAAVRAEFGTDAKEYHLLHPPILRALGMKRKIRLGSWFRPGFAVLRAMKPLRGTPFDPFGRTRVRRTERGLIVEYRIMIEDALDGLSVETHARAVELAALPDMIRGYEEIKLANVEKYRARAAELLPARSVAVRLPKPFGYGGSCQPTALAAQAGIIAGPRGVFRALDDEPSRTAALHSSGRRARPELGGRRAFTQADTRLPPHPRLRRCRRAAAAHPRLRPRRHPQGHGQGPGRDGAPGAKSAHAVSRSWTPPTPPAPTGSAAGGRLPRSCPARPGSTSPARPTSRKRTQG